MEFVHKLQWRVRDRCEREKKVSELWIVKIREMGGIDRSVMEIAAPVDME